MERKSCTEDRGKQRGEEEQASADYAKTCGQRRRRWGKRGCGWRGRRRRKEKNDHLRIVSLWENRKG